VQDYVFIVIKIFNENCFLKTEQLAVFCSANEAADFVESKTRNNSDKSVKFYIEKY
jgi:hypothetical protein